MITQEIFSLYISPAVSYINFGAYNQTAIKSGSTIQWITMPTQSMFWFHQIMGVRIGTNLFTNNGYTSSWYYDGKNDASA